jgi:predicted DNA-binding transcriptional regulator AlpA
MGMKDLDSAATLLDRKEVAQRLGISVFTLSRWVKSGRFPKPIKIAFNKYRWRLLDVARWIDVQARKHSEPRPIVGRAAQLVAKAEARSKRQPSVKRVRLYA